MIDTSAGIEVTHRATPGGNRVALSSDGRAPLSAPRAVPLVLATVTILTACEAPPPALEVGGIGYSESELLGLSESRRAALMELTAFGLMVARDEVDSVGRPRLDALELDELRRRVVVEEILREAGVGDDVLEARYASNPEYELTVRHLIVLSARYEPDEQRAQARAKAGRALERIRAGEPFPDVAAEVSEEPGAEGRQGLLQPGREGAWVDEFWSAANALDEGAISGVVETQYGFHVLRLEGREVVPFAEVRPRIAREVAEMIAPVDPDAADAPTPEALRERAEEAGIAIEPEWRSAPSGEWRAEIDRIARTLGFRPGLDDDGVKAAALTALGATGQLVELARDEVAAMRDLLGARYRF